MEEEKHGELQVGMTMSLYPIGITHPYCTHEETHDHVQVQFCNVIHIHAGSRVSMDYPYLRRTCILNYNNYINN
jgi:hypothetical protein